VLTALVVGAAGAAVALRLWPALAAGPPAAVVTLVVAAAMVCYGAIDTRQDAGGVRNSNA
jgi:hypothetical protein